MQITHREQIKAAIRMKFGSLGAFEIARELPLRSVTDVLRGKPNRRTTTAIAKEVGCDVDHVISLCSESAIATDSAADESAHAKKLAGAK